MKKELYELVNAWKAKEKTFYIYEGVIYQYGKIKDLKHKDRFFRVCKADNWENKLKEDLNNGWNIVNVKE